MVNRNKNLAQNTSEVLHNVILTIRRYTKMMRILISKIDASLIPIKRLVSTASTKYNSVSNMMIKELSSVEQEVNTSDNPALKTIFNNYQVAISMFSQKVERIKVLESALELIYGKTEVTENDIAAIVEEEQRAERENQEE